MLGDLVVTSGVDQRLILRRHSRTETEERVSSVGSKCVIVADTLTEDKEAGCGVSGGENGGVES